MDTSMLEVGEVYNHEDFGRVRLEELPREEPNAARVVILGGKDANEDRTVTVDRESLSMVDLDWNPNYGASPSQDIL